MQSVINVTSPLRQNMIFRCLTSLIEDTIPTFETLGFNRTVLFSCAPAIVKTRLDN